jgi:hypothetical protein
MPAKAGIQQRIDSFDVRSLDTGFRRYDESFFNMPLDPTPGFNLVNPVNPVHLLLR